MTSAAASLSIHNLGTVTIGAGGRDGPGSFHKALYRLSPNRSLRARGARTVEFPVLTTSDGFRRFFPSRRQSVTEWLEQAARFGLAWQSLQHHLGAAERLDQAAMLETYCSSIHLQERVKLRLTTLTRFTMLSSYRAVLGREDLLPHDIGRSTVDDRRWSLCDWNRLGCEAARDDGWAAPSEARSLVYGWYRAGLRNPLRLPSDQATSLMQCALFDLSETTDRISAEQAAAVRAGLLGTVARRGCRARDQNDCRPDFVKAIAKSRDASGGLLGRDVARRGLLDLAWAGHTLVAEAVETFARVLSASLPLPLSDYESQYFAATFFRREYFGGLSLLLLQPRCGLLRPILADLWERPDDERTIGALHRVLAQFAEIAPFMRKLERIKKRLKRPQNLDELWLRHDEPRPKRDNRSPKPAELLEHWEDCDSVEAFVRDALERRKLRCPVCQSTPVATLLLARGDQWDFDLCCPGHFEGGNVTLSTSELSRAQVSFLREPSLT